MSQRSSIPPPNILFLNINNYLVQFMKKLFFPTNLSNNSDHTHENAVRVLYKCLRCDVIITPFAQV